MFELSITGPANPNLVLRVEPRSPSAASLIRVSSISDVDRSSCKSSEISMPRIAGLLNCLPELEYFATGTVMWL